MRNWATRARRGRSPFDVSSARVVHNLNAASSQMTLETGSKISTWNDQSGSARNGTQGTDASRPIFSSNGGPNSLSCVQFGTASGNGQFVNFGSAFSALTAAEIFIVRKANADPSPGPGGADEGGIWHFGTNVNGDLAPFSDGNIYDAFGSTARKSTGNPTASLSNWHIYNVTSISGEWTSRINGTQHFTTATNTVAFDTATRLGSTLGGAVGASSMTTLWIFDAKLSTADRAFVHTWLDREWQLGLGL